VADTALVCSRMGSVRNSCGMQRDVSGGYIIPTHKITIYIIQHLIAVDVTVVVGRGNTLRMIVIEPRHKRTDHKCISLKSLMNRWRLMNSPGDGFKIVNGKSIRKIIAVIAHNIKRM